MLETSKKLPLAGSLTFSQEGCAGRTGPSVRADSRFWFMDAWMFDKSPVYQTWEDRDRLIFQFAFPPHPPPHALAGRWNRGFISERPPKVKERRGFNGPR